MPRIPPRYPSSVEGLRLLLKDQKEGTLLPEGAHVKFWIDNDDEVVDGHVILADGTPGEYLIHLGVPEDAALFALTLLGFQAEHV